MKITLVTHSDSRGGAAVVTLRLAHALRDCGVDVVVLAANVETDDPVVKPLASPTAVRMAFLAEHIDIFRHRGVRRDNLFYGYGRTAAVAASGYCRCRCRGSRLGQSGNGVAARHTTAARRIS